MEKVREKDFVELKYTGYSQGGIFDSNIPEDLEKISKEPPRETIVVVGAGMVVPGLDKALQGKEIGKEYRVKIGAGEGFGPRKRDLVKTIPLKVFTERKINPEPGAMFTLDEMLVKIVAVSGARVIADFNNPLAGKEIEYKFTVVRKITDESEKAKALFNTTFRFVPDFEVKEDVVVRGPKNMEVLVNAFKERFKELHGKELRFEPKQMEKFEEKKKPEKVDKKKSKAAKEEVKAPEGPETPTEEVVAPQN